MENTKTELPEKWCIRKNIKQIMENKAKIPTECYFIAGDKTSSATICANCGKEKYIHTIGEGIKASKIIIYSSK